MMYETRFKAAMRRMAATVSVVTTGDGERRYGMTATAVTSVSMDPPSLLVCVNRNASIHTPLQEQRRFCVNVLGAAHQTQCSVFSGSEKGEERFRHGSWYDHKQVPYLSDAQGNIFCDVEVEVPYGTHTVFIGRVTDCFLRDTPEPLIFVDGDFRLAEHPRLMAPPEPWPVSPYVKRAQPFVPA